MQYRFRKADFEEIPSKHGKGDATFYAFSASEILLSGLIFTLFAGFLGVAYLRALNFDESLVLRAGWLLFEGAEGYPSMYMPFTMAVGAATHFITDPEVLIKVLRLTVALSTLGVVVLVISRSVENSLTRKIAICLVLLNGSFICHAMESRYDWAINLAWGLGFFLINVKSRWKDFFLGALSLWLAVHHLKGVFFATFLSLIAIFASSSNIRGRIICGIRFAGGFFVGAIIWLILSISFGKVPLLLDTYRIFLGVAEESSQVSVVGALGPSIQQDSIWWFVVAAGGAIAIFRGLRKRETWLVVAFAAVPAAFIGLHPHAWRYMLVPLVPFVSILASTVIVDWLIKLNAELPRIVKLMVLLIAGVVFMEFGEFGHTPLKYWLLIFGLAFGSALIAYLFSSPRSSWRWVCAAAPFVVLPFTAASVSGWAHFARSFDSPMDEQVRMMRTLKMVSVDADAVLDPSGLAYFRRPASSEWYVDTLFADLVDRNVWMAQVPPAVPERWVVKTYRLRMLPAREVERIKSDYCPFGASLLRLRVSSEVCSPKLGERDSMTHLASFW